MCVITSCNKFCDFFHFFQVSHFRKSFLWTPPPLIVTWIRYTWYGTLALVAFLTQRLMRISGRYSSHKSNLPILLIHNQSLKHHLNEFHFLFNSFREIKNHHEWTSTCSIYWMMKFITKLKWQRWTKDRVILLIQAKRRGQSGSLKQQSRWCSVQCNEIETSIQAAHASFMEIIVHSQRFQNAYLSKLFNLICEFVLQTVCAGGSDDATEELSDWKIACIFRNCWEAYHFQSIAAISLMGWRLDSFIKFCCHWKSKPVSGRKIMNLAMTERIDFDLISQWKTSTKATKNSNIYWMRKNNVSWKCKTLMQLKRPDVGNKIKKVFFFIYLHIFAFYNKKKGFDINA